MLRGALLDRGGAGAAGAAGGVLPPGTTSGQLLMWDGTLWVPQSLFTIAGTYRFTATDFQVSAAQISLGFSGALVYTDASFNAFGRVLPRTAVQTSDATVTTLVSFAVPDNTTINMFAMVSADQNGGANSGGYVRIATIKRAAAGAATLVGAVTADHTGEDVAGWDCTIAVGFPGVNDAAVRVTGAIATTIDWRQYTLIQLGA